MLNALATTRNLDHLDAEDLLEHAVDDVALHLHVLRSLGREIRVVLTDDNLEPSNVILGDDVVFDRPRAEVVELLVGEDAIVLAVEGRDVEVVATADEDARDEVVAVGQIAFADLAGHLVELLFVDEFVAVHRVAGLQVVNLRLQDDIRRLHAVQLTIFEVEGDLLVLDRALVVIHGVSPLETLYQTHKTKSPSNAFSVVVDTRGRKYRCVSILSFSHIKLA